MDQTLRYLTFLCVHTSNVEICKSKRQLISGVKGVRAQMGLHLLHDDRGTDNSEYMAVTVVKGGVVHFQLQSSAFVVSKPREGTMKNVGGLFICAQD